MDTKMMMPKTTCPSCRRDLNGAARLNGDETERPQVGDYSICLYCHSGLVFTDDFELRLATSSENEEIWNEMCKTTLKEYDIEQKVS